MIGLKAASRQIGFRWAFWARVAAPAAVAAVFVLAVSFPTFPGDQWTMEQVPMLRHPWPTGAAIGLAYAGWLPAAAGLSLAALSGLWFYGGRSRFLVALSGAGLVALGIGLKVVVGRSRPEYALGAASSGLPGFPSGHAVFATIFFGLAMIFIEDWVNPGRWRIAVRLALLLPILVMGLSRVYLGTHWPSDVLGGWLYGGAALVELAWLKQRLNLRPPAPEKTVS